MRTRAGPRYRCHLSNDTRVNMTNWSSPAAISAWGCPRWTFTQTTGELPLRAQCTTRLRTALLTAVIDQGQPVAQVAQDHQGAWWTA